MQKPRPSAENYNEKRSSTATVSVFPKSYLSPSLTIQKGEKDN